jgi:hypothetical protein
MSKKWMLVASIVFFAITALAITVFLSQNISIFDSPDTNTLYQGTQMKYENISIGLSNVEDKSGWLLIYKSGDAGNPVKKLVTAGDKFDAYNYTVEVKSVSSRINFIPRSGASNGYIKFIITKK